MECLVIFCNNFFWSPWITPLFFIFLQENELEQMCINLCAEKLQQYYNDVIFRDPMVACMDEGIQANNDCSFFDNSPIVNVICAPVCLTCHLFPLSIKSETISCSMILLTFVLFVVAANGHPQLTWGGVQFAEREHWIILAESSGSAQ